MTDLNKISLEIDEILAREVSRLAEEPSLDFNEIKMLEILSKILTQAKQRRDAMPIAKWTTEMKDEELEDAFEEKE